MAEKSIEEKSRRIASRPIENGKEFEQMQAAQNQLLEIQAAQKQGLIEHKLMSDSDAAQNQVMAQAAQLGAMSEAGGMQLNSATQATMGKYGLSKPMTTTSSKQSRSQTVTRQNVTINNNTTNITNNSVPANVGGPVQGRPVQMLSPQKGQDSGNTARFKNWISQTFAKQEEAQKKRDVEYRRKETSLTKSANKMARKLEEFSKDVTKKLDPRNIGKTAGSQLKTILGILGIGVITKNLPKIVDWLYDTEDKIRTKWIPAIKDFFKWVRGENTDENGNNKAPDFITRISDSISRAFGTTLFGEGWEPQEGKGLIKSIYDVLWNDTSNKDHRGVLNKLWDKITEFFHDRAEMAKSVIDHKHPPLAFFNRWLEHTMTNLMNYLSVFLGGEKAMETVQGREMTSSGYASISKGARRDRTPQNQTVATAGWVEQSEKGNLSVTGINAVNERDTRAGVSRAGLLYGKDIYETNRMEFLYDLENGKIGEGSNAKINLSGYRDYSGFLDVKTQTIKENIVGHAVEIAMARHLIWLETTVIPHRSKTKSNELGRTMADVDLHVAGAIQTGVYYTPVGMFSPLGALNKAAGNVADLKHVHATVKSDDTSAIAAIYTALYKRAVSKGFVIVPKELLGFNSTDIEEQLKHPGVTKLSDKLWWVYVPNGTQNFGKQEKYELDLLTEGELKNYPDIEKRNTAPTDNLYCLRPDGVRSIMHNKYKSEEHANTDEYDEAFFKNESHKYQDYILKGVQERIGGEDLRVDKKINEMYDISVDRQQTKTPDEVRAEEQQLMEASTSSFTPAAAAKQHTAEVGKDFQKKTGFNVQPGISENYATATGGEIQEDGIIYGPSGAFDTKAAAAFIAHHAHAKSKGKCGRYVGYALMEGGMYDSQSLNENTRPNGGDYGPVLKRLGWSEIDPNTPPQPGDVMVLKKESEGGAGKWGHVAMYAGTEYGGHSGWFSDFDQATPVSAHGKTKLTDSGVSLFRYGVSYDYRPGVSKIDFGRYHKKTDAVFVDDDTPGDVSALNETDVEPGVLSKAWNNIKDFGTELIQKNTVRVKRGIHGASALIGEGIDAENARHGNIRYTDVPLPKSLQNIVNAYLSQKTWWGKYFDSNGNLKAEIKDDKDIPQALKDKLGIIETELKKQTALSAGNLEMAGQSIDAYMLSAASTNTTLNRQIHALTKRNARPYSAEFNKEIENSLK